MGLTVAVTGPTGEIGIALIDALEALRCRRGGAGDGAARRSTRRRRAGGKATYQRGDILDRGHLAELFDGADVAVHLAFAIFGDREETRRINLEGSRNVFEAAVEAGVRRLVYASSVAAYGFHPENPQPLTEEAPALGSAGLLLLGPEGRAGGGARRDPRRLRARRLRLPPLHRRRAAGDDADRADGRRRPARRPGCRACAATCSTGSRCCGRSSPTPACRCSWSTTTTSPRRWPPRSRAGASPAPTTSPATARSASATSPGALGWRSVRVPATGARRRHRDRRPTSRFIDPQLEWATALSTPVLMDTSKARRELGLEAALRRRRDPDADRRLGPRSGLLD